MEQAVTAEGSATSASTVPALASFHPRIVAPGSANRGRYLTADRKYGLTAVGVGSCLSAQVPRVNRNVHGATVPPRCAGRDELSRGEWRRWNWMFFRSPAHVTVEVASQQVRKEQRSPSAGKLLEVTQTQNVGLGIVAAETIHECPWEPRSILIAQDPLLTVSRDRGGRFLRFTRYARSSH